jgi:hypothetical protein
VVLAASKANDRFVYSTPEIGERLGFAELTDGRVKTRAKQRMRPMNAEYTHLS